VVGFAAVAHFQETIMASLFKVWISRKNPDGSTTKEKSKKWYGQYKSGDGRTVRKPLCEDREASQAMLAEEIKRANKIRAGVIDKYDDHRKRPLAEHLKDFEASLKSKGCTPDHVAQLMGRVRRIVSGCKFKFIPDIEGSAVDRFLTVLKETEDLGTQTINFYLQAIKQFARWLMLERRNNDNPLVHLRAGNVRCDIRRQRRELSDAEISRLLEATRGGVMRSCLTGEERFMLYATALGTGLRASELASLTPRSFDLAGDYPTVAIEAANEKARRGATLPLPPDLVALLKPWLSQITTGARVWPGVWAAQKRGGKMIHDDLEAAKIAWVAEVENDPVEREARERDDFLSSLNSAGERIDFHCLRHTYLTRLSRSGASPKAMQELARHSDIRLTLGRYAHASLHDLGAAVRALPALPTGKTAVCATGNATLKTA
jgi:integrase